jgi:hypothetical protein
LRSTTWVAITGCRNRESQPAVKIFVYDRDRFGVQYDPSNAIVAGDDPIELLKQVALTASSACTQAIATSPKTRRSTNYAKPTAPSAIHRTFVTA